VGDEVGVDSHLGVLLSPNTPGGGKSITPRVDNLYVNGFREQSSVVFFQCDRLPTRANWSVHDQTTIAETTRRDIKCRRGDSEDESDIFEKPWLLEIDNVPDANRIVGRDDHITFLAKNLRKMRTNSVPDNVLESGRNRNGEDTSCKTRL